MTILLEVGTDGKQYSNFTTANATVALDKASGSFNFTAVSTKAIPLPFKGGEPCSIIVENQKVITGFIENIEVSYDSKSHKIVIQGRDKTADLIDSTLNNIKLNAGITLKRAIEEVLKEIKLDVEVIEEVETEPFNEAEDKLNAKIGQNAFEFCEKLARKRQVLLTRDGLGNIVITNGIGKDDGAILQNKIPQTFAEELSGQAPINNIETGSVSYDLTKMYSRYIFKSQLNPVAANFAGEVPIVDMTRQETTTTDEAINSLRESRQLVIKSENASGKNQLQKRADWEANIRKSRGVVYSCTTNQFKDSKGNLFKPNALIQVIDDFCGINSKLLLNSVQYSFDKESGTQSTLSFLPANAYTLSLSEPETNKTGKDFTPVFDESRL